MNENEHIELSESIISWMEGYRASIDLDNLREENEEDLCSSTQQKADLLRNMLSPMSLYHELSPPGLALNLVKSFSRGLKAIDSSIRSLSINDRDSKKRDMEDPLTTLINEIPSPKSLSSSPDIVFDKYEMSGNLLDSTSIAAFNHDNNLATSSYVRTRGTDEWAPPRAQIIFNIPEESDFKKSMQRQNYRCSGCGTKIDLGLARKSVLYCHYLGKYFCKCCFSHKAVHLPGYILQKWDFHKYPVSQFALQLLNRIANEPLFNINDINSSLYRKVKKLRHLVDIRMQLYYLKIYISACADGDKLGSEFTTFTHQHLLQDDVHVYSLNDLIEIQHGKLYEYLNDLVTRSIAHISNCDFCREKGHYNQLRMITQVSLQSKNSEFLLK